MHFSEKEREREREREKEREREVHVELRGMHTQLRRLLVYQGKDNGGKFRVLS